MGEVFLAEDTWLKRKVALKILPEKFSADFEPLRRFKLEAKAAPALNTAIAEGIATHRR